MYTYVNLPQWSEQQHNEMAQLYSNCRVSRIAGGFSCQDNVSSDDVKILAFLLCLSNRANHYAISGLSTLPQ
jgi:hypothetical protein